MTGRAQDTLSPVIKKPQRPHEIGFSASTIFFVMAGVSDFNERYTNLTYRYLPGHHHGLKAFAGINMFNANNEFRSGVVSVTQSTVYATTERISPSNFQLGLGYEYIIGKRRLQQVVGLDVLYNNKFEIHRSYYTNSRDSTDNRGQHYIYTSRIDTGAHTTATNYDKFGLNLNYALRYSLSKRWLLTASMLVSYKTYRRREQQGYSRVSELNFNGLISDVSVFYRF